MSDAPNDTPVLSVAGRLNLTALAQGAREVMLSDMAAYDGAFIEMQKDKGKSSEQEIEALTELAEKSRDSITVEAHPFKCAITFDMREATRSRMGTDDLFAICGIVAKGFEQLLNGEEFDEHQIIDDETIDPEEMRFTIEAEDPKALRAKIHEIMPELTDELDSTYSEIGPKQLTYRG